MSKTTKEYQYFVEGMHCASCELIIEKKLLALPEVQSVDASTGKKQVVVEYENKRPSVNHLNQLFAKEGYTFHEKPTDDKTDKNTKSGWFSTLLIAGLVIGVFITLNKLGVSGLVNVSQKSSLPTFFVFGLIAGISSCAALVGGIVLSMSKQWHDLYQGHESTWTKLQPHLIFNAGRIISYALLGALLGVIGNQLNISLKFTSTLVILVSVLMLLLALQMLGVKALQRFQITMPKFITRYAADENHFKGRYMPFIMGALTFFLPCGFTITAQGLALLSGNPLQGSLIMLLFALGTLPALLFIGFSSVKMTDKPHLSAKFVKVAGIIVAFFAIFNLNNQLNVLGVKSFNNLNFAGSKASQDTNVQLPPIVNGKQLIKMDATSSRYNPNQFKVLAGTPVRWEITDKGTSGCTNAVIANGLFQGPIQLTLNQVSVKEFTPEKPGKYKFSCWMGMVSGVIEVVDKNSSKNSAAASSQIVPSGASGCGCGGGSPS